MKELYDMNGNVVPFADGEVAAALARGYSEEDPLEGSRPKDRAEKILRAHMRRRRRAMKGRAVALSAGNAASAEQFDRLAKEETERVRALRSGEWNGEGIWPRPVAQRGE